MQNLFWLFLLGCMWAPSFLFIKIGLGGFPPLTLAALRLSLAAVLMLGVLRIRGIRLPRAHATWKDFLIMGFFANALPFALFSLGEQYADSGMASIINGTTPIFTALFAHLAIREERLTPVAVTGVLIGFAGVLVIFLPQIDSAFSGSHAVFGLAAFAIASTSYGVSTVFARLRLRGQPPLVTPAGQFITSSMLLLPVALIVEQPFCIQPDAAELASLVILALFGTVIAYLIFYRLIADNPATFVSYVTYILPPGGVVLGMVFLDEQPGWSAAAGCALVLSGVMIVNGLFTRRIPATEKTR